MKNNSRNFSIALVAFILVLVGAAIWQYTKKTQEGSEQVICTLEAKAGLNIILKDDAGNMVSDATILADEETTPWSEIPPSSGSYSGLYEQEGRHTFTITKSGYDPYNGVITLQKDECHVIPQKQEITLKKAAPQS